MSGFPQPDFKDALIAVHFQCQGEKPFKNPLSKSPDRGPVLRKQSNNGRMDIFEPIGAGAKSRNSVKRKLRFNPSLRGASVIGFSDEAISVYGLLMRRKMYT